MKWRSVIDRYVFHWCIARGLRDLTTAAYRDAIWQFRRYVHDHCGDAVPEQVDVDHVLDYLIYLKEKRGNQACTRNRVVTILRGFYRCLVSRLKMQPQDNPMAQLGPVKKAPHKIPAILSRREVKRLLKAPRTDTILGLRDRALLTLLCATGIRASECADLKDQHVDLDMRLIYVTGKGGHQRSVAVGPNVTKTLARYRAARGRVGRNAAFFKSRRGGGLTRYAIYERVKTYAHRARIRKHVTPHTLRHTCATHLVSSGEDLIRVRDLLGHQCLSSTQLYLHVTARDLREAADNHPIEELVDTVDTILPIRGMRFQHPPGTEFAFGAT